MLFEIKEESFVCFYVLSFRWNPLIYIVRNGNFRMYLPFFARYRHAREGKLCLVYYILLIDLVLFTERNLGEIRFSIYPYSMVHISLLSRRNLRES